MDADVLGIWFAFSEVSIDVEVGGVHIIIAVIQVLCGIDISLLPQMLIVPVFCMQFFWGKKIISSLIVPCCNWSFFADCGPLMVTITRRQKKRMLDTVHDLLDCHNLYPYFINSWSSRVVRQVLLRGWKIRLGDFLVVARFGICLCGPVYRE